MNTRNMQKYYRAILKEVSIVYWWDPDYIHELMKCWYHKKTTSWMSFDEWKDFLENVLLFMACVFDMMFDVNWYHEERISYTWLFWTMSIQYPQYKRPDNFYLLF